MSLLGSVLLMLIMGYGISLDVQDLRYAVLALGSSMYPAFCACGREIDARLAVHGARRLFPRVDADTKYVADFRRWLDEVTAALEPPP